LQQDRQNNPPSSPRLKQNGDSILRVESLRSYFFLEEGVLKAVDGASFSVGSGKILGLIGESGCGKTVAAQSILSIVPPPGRIVSGSVWFQSHGKEPVDLVDLDPEGKEIRRIRGREISMIFQEPLTSLSPVHSVGNQMMEGLLLHRTGDKEEAFEIAIELLQQVGISNPGQRIKEYPHQLSGGMRQRVMIAIAISCHPLLLIADEPTTALDVTVQAQILELLAELQAQVGMAILYITHDLGVVAEICSEVVVMYLGRIVERGPVREIFHSPLHPYTERLMKSIPRIGKAIGARLEAIRGNVPVPLDPPAQCGFFERCDRAMKGICDGAIPALVPMEKNHEVRCFLHSDKVELEVE